MGNPLYGDESGQTLVVPGFLRGYRCWGITPIAPLDGKAVLTARARYYAWSPGLNTATCIGGLGHAFSCMGGLEHRAIPAVHCSCGFYARLKDAKHGYPTGVMGVVRASGRIILGTEGFRAERAEVEALYYSPIAEVAYERFHLGKDYYGMLHLLGEAYGVPVFDSWEEAVAAMPPSDVSELLKKIK